MPVFNRSVCEVDILQSAVSVITAGTTATQPVRDHRVTEAGH